MNYTVIWEPPAENDLAAAWIASADRPAITRAAHQLDQDLAQDPFARGFPRDSSVNRTAIEIPIGIEFEIIEDGKKVRVLRVWSIM
jgi:hypothetical protein